MAVNDGRHTGDKPIYIAIIQARMGSSRLPGKVLADLEGKPVIDWVYRRVARIEGLDAVVIATSTAPQDDPLVRHCETHGMPVSRGDEHDVLDRFYRVGQQFGATAVMRITADCPLIDPRRSQQVLETFVATPGCQYASNIEPRSVPDGLDTEMVDFATLEGLWRETTDPQSREHVTLYLRRHLDDFRTAAVGGEPEWANLRLTLDTEDDLRLLRDLARRLCERNWFGHLEQIAALLSGPEHQPTRGLFHDS